MSLARSSQHNFRTRKTVKSGQYCSASAMKSDLRRELCEPAVRRKFEVSSTFHQKWIGFAFLADGRQFSVARNDNGFIRQSENCVVQ